MRRIVLQLGMFVVCCLSCFSQVPSAFNGDLRRPLRFVGAPIAIASADVNHDGHLDVVAINSDGTIAIYLGNGDGTLGQPSFISLPQGVTLSSIALADLDGDGNPDIVAGDSNSGKFSSGGAVWTLMGNGNGAFQSPVSHAAGTSIT